MTRLDCVWYQDGKCELQKDEKEFECYGCNCCFSMLTFEFSNGR